MTPLNRIFAALDDSKALLSPARSLDSLAYATADAQVFEQQMQSDRLGGTEITQQRLCGTQPGTVFSSQVSEAKQWIIIEISGVVRRKLDGLSMAYGVCNRSCIIHAWLYLWGA